MNKTSKKCIAFKIPIPIPVETQEDILETERINSFLADFCNSWAALKILLQIDLEKIMRATDKKTLFKGCANASMGCFFTGVFALTMDKNGLSEKGKHKFKVELTCLKEQALHLAFLEKLMQNSAVVGAYEDVGIKPDDYAYLEDFLEVLHAINKHSDTALRLVDLVAFLEGLVLPIERSLALSVMQEASLADSFSPVSSSGSGGGSPKKAHPGNRQGKSGQGKFVHGKSGHRKGRPSDKSNKK
jgi:hypothetical protein